MEAGLQLCTALYVQTLVEEDAGVRRAQLMIIFVFVFFLVFSRRQIKGNCAESFTDYWTCLDYSNLTELRRCRQQQHAFDSCVLDKLGWERPQLGDLSKVRAVRAVRATFQDAAATATTTLMNLNVKHISASIYGQ